MLDARPDLGSSATRGRIVNNELLKVDNLTKFFPVTKGLILMKTVGQVQAVDHINFSINEGETLGLVGELNSVLTSALSIILPAYMTATLSHILATIPKSCVIKMMARPVSC